MFEDIENQIKALIKAYPSINRLSIQVNKDLTILWVLLLKNGDEKSFSSSIGMFEFIDTLDNKKGLAASLDKVKKIVDGLIFKPFKP